MSLKAISTTHDCRLQPQEKKNEHCECFNSEDVFVVIFSTDMQVTEQQ